MTGALSDSLFAMQTQIEQDLKAAMKSGDKRRVSTLRLLLSVMKNERINSQRELTAEEAEAVIRRAVKQRKESIEVYDRTGRADLAAAEKEELGILEAYLPQAMSDAELEESVRAISCARFPSARPRCLAISSFMRCPTSFAEEKPFSEMIARTVSSSSASDMACGR
jgi:uncharacterized protein YqeY